MNDIRMSMWTMMNVMIIFDKNGQVTLEAQLGLIGGTMGLLTGFSILSGVEIVFFLIKILVKCAKDGTEMLASMKKK